MTGLDLSRLVLFRTLLCAALATAAVLPLVLGALRTDASRDRRLLWVSLGFLVLSMGATLLPTLDLLDRLRWNWQGKIVQTGVALAFIWFLAATGRSSPRATGLRLDLVPGSARPLLVAALVATAIPAAFVVLGASLPLDLETLLFELTMPGIAEELFYRGALQTALERVFRGRRQLFGARVGWGYVIATVLFGIVHAVGVDWNLELSVNPLSGVGPLIGGAILGWMRTRGGSVWPPIVAHNLGNTAIVIGSTL